MSNIQAFFETIMQVIFAGIYKVILIYTGLFHGNGFLQGVVSIVIGVVLLLIGCCILGLEKDEYLREFEADRTMAMCYTYFVFIAAYRVLVQGEEEVTVILHFPQWMTLVKVIAYVALIMLLLSVIYCLFKRSLSYKLLPLLLVSMVAFPESACLSLLRWLMYLHIDGFLLHMLRLIPVCICVLWGGGLLAVWPLMVIGFFSPQLMGAAASVYSGGSSPEPQMGGTGGSAGSGASAGGESEFDLHRMPQIVYDDNNRRWERSYFNGDEVVYHDQDGNEVYIYHGQVSGSSANTSVGRLHWY